MTCIIGLKDNKQIVMGSDSRIMSGNFIFNSNSNKIIEFENMLIGFCGSCRIHDTINSSFVMPDNSAGKSDLQYLQSTFVNAIRECLECAKTSFVEENSTASMDKSALLILYHDKFYTVECDYSILEYSDFVAIGSGSDFALGALEVTKGLEPELRVTKALEAACKFNAGCAPPFQIIKKTIK